MWTWRCSVTVGEGGRRVVARHVRGLGAMLLKPRGLVRVEPFGERGGAIEACEVAAAYGLRLLKDFVLAQVARQHVQTEEEVETHRARILRRRRERSGSRC